ncbi:MAG: hypothetical protein PHO08_16035 [Methylococcales bacterium]|nr:hypothetical protein [Methylococcales bacterium]
MPQRVNDQKAASPDATSDKVPGSGTVATTWALSTNLISRAQGLVR